MGLIDAKGRGGMLGDGLKELGSGEGVPGVGNGQINLAGVMSRACKPIIGEAEARRLKVGEQLTQKQS